MIPRSASNIVPGAPPRCSALARGRAAYVAAALFLALGVTVGLDPTSAQADPSAAARQATQSVIESVLESVRDRVRRVNKQRNARTSCRAVRQRPCAEYEYFEYRKETNIPP
jgi:hypothetical protein